MRTMLVSVLVFLASTTALAVEELKSPDQVKAAFAKGRPMIIMFGADWCGACRVTKPEYAKAEKQLAGKVDFYYMNSDKLRLRMDKDFDGIPAFVTGTSEKNIRAAGSLITGSRKAADFVDYIKKNTGVK